MAWLLPAETPHLWLPGEPLPRWGSEIHQEDGWPPDQPPQAGWSPGWVGRVSLRKAHPQARLGASGDRWPLKNPPDIRTAWSPPLQPLGSFLTPWSPLSSLGPNGNNKAFCRKKKKKERENSLSHILSYNLILKYRVGLLWSLGRQKKGIIAFSF